MRSGRKSVDAKQPTSQLSGSRLSKVSLTRSGNLSEKLIETVNRLSKPKASEDPFIFSTVPSPRTSNAALETEALFQQLQKKKTKSSLTDTTLRGGNYGAPISSRNSGSNHHKTPQDPVNSVRSGGNERKLTTQASPAEEKSTENASNTRLRRETGGSVKQQPGPPFHRKPESSGSTLPVAQYYSKDSSAHVTPTHKPSPNTYKALPAPKPSIPQPAESGSHPKKEVPLSDSLRDFYHEAAEHLASMASEDDISDRTTPSNWILHPQEKAPVEMRTPDKGQIRTLVPGMQPVSSVQKTEAPSPRPVPIQALLPVGDSDMCCTSGKCKRCSNRGLKRPSSSYRDPKARGWHEENVKQAQNYFGLVYHCLNEVRAGNYIQSPIVKRFLRKKTSLDYDTVVKVPAREFYQWKTEMTALQRSLYKSIAKQKNLDFIFADLMGMVHGVGDEVEPLDDVAMSSDNFPGDYLEIPETTLMQLLQQHQWLLTLRDDLQEYIKINHTKNVKIAAELRRRELHRQREAREATRLAAAEFRNHTAEALRARDQQKRFERTVNYQVEKAREAETTRQQEKRNFIGRATARHDRYMKLQERSKPRNLREQRYGEHVVRPFRHDSRDLSPQVKAVISSLLLPTPSANFTPDRSVLPPSSPIQDLVPKWTLSLPSLVPPVSATQSPAPPRPSARLSMRRKIEDEERPWESYNSEDDGSESVSIDLRASPSLFDVPSFTNEQNRSETLEREVKDQSALHPAKEEQNEAVADLSWPKEETQYDTNQASGEVVDQTKEYHQDQRMPPCVYQRQIGSMEDVPLCVSDSDDRRYDEFMYGGDTPTPYQAVETNEISPYEDPKIMSPSTVPTTDTREPTKPSNGRTPPYQQTSIQRPLPQFRAHDPGDMPTSRPNTGGAKGPATRDAGNDPIDIESTVSPPVGIPAAPVTRDTGQDPGEFIKEVTSGSDTVISHAGVQHSEGDIMHVSVQHSNTGAADAGSQRSNSNLRHAEAHESTSHQSPTDKPIVEVSTAGVQRSGPTVYDIETQKSARDFSYSAAQPSGEFVYDVGTITHKSGNTATIGTDPEEIYMQDKSTNPVAQRMQQTGTQESAVDVFDVGAQKNQSGSRNAGARPAESNADVVHMGIQKNDLGDHSVEHRCPTTVPVTTAHANAQTTGYSMVHSGTNTMTLDVAHAATCPSDESLRPSSSKAVASRLADEATQTENAISLGSSDSELEVVLLMLDADSDLPDTSDTGADPVPATEFRMEISANTPQSPSGNPVAVHAATQHSIPDLGQAPAQYNSAETQHASTQHNVVDFSHAAGQIVTDVRDAETQSILPDIAHKEADQSAFNLSQSSSEVDCEVVILYVGSESNEHIPGITNPVTDNLGAEANDSHRVGTNPSLVDIAHAGVQHSELSVTRPDVANVGGQFSGPESSLTVTQSPTVNVSPSSSVTDCEVVLLFLDDESDSIHIPDAFVRSNEEFPRICDTLTRTMPRDMGTQWSTDDVLNSSPESNFAPSFTLTKSLALSNSPATSNFYITESEQHPTPLFGQSEASLVNLNQNPLSIFLPQDVSKEDFVTVAVLPKPLPVEHEFHGRSINQGVDIDLSDSGPGSVRSFSPAEIPKISPQPSTNLITSAISVTVFDDEDGCMGTQTDLTPRPIQTTMNIQKSISVSRNHILPRLMSSISTETEMTALRPAPLSMFAPDEGSHGRPPLTRADLTPTYLGPQKSSSSIRPKNVSSTESTETDVTPSRGYLTPITTTSRIMSRPLPPPVPSQQDLIDLKPAPLSLFSPHDDMEDKHVLTRADLAPSRSYLTPEKSQSKIMPQSSRSMSSEKTDDVPMLYHADTLSKRDHLSPRQPFQKDLSDRSLHESPSKDPSYDDLASLRPNPLSGFLPTASTHGKTISTRADIASKHSYLSPQLSASRTQGENASGSVPQPSHEELVHLRPAPLSAFLPQDESTGKSVLTRADIAKSRSGLNPHLADSNKKVNAFGKSASDSALSGIRPSPVMSMFLPNSENHGTNILTRADITGSRSHLAPQSPTSKRHLVSSVQKIGGKSVLLVPAKSRTANASTFLSTQDIGEDISEAPLEVSTQTYFPEYSQLPRPAKKNKEASPWPSSIKPKSDLTIDIPQKAPPVARADNNALRSVASTLLKPQLSCEDQPLYISGGCRVLASDGLKLPLTPFGSRQNLSMETLGSQASSVSLLGPTPLSMFFPTDNMDNMASKGPPDDSQSRSNSPTRPRLSSLDNDSHEIVDSLLDYASSGGGGGSTEPSPVPSTTEFAEDILASHAPHTSVVRTASSANDIGVKQSKNVISGASSTLSLPVSDAASTSSGSSYNVENILSDLVQGVGIMDLSLVNGRSAHWLRSLDGIRDSHLGNVSDAASRHPREDSKEVTTNEESIMRSQSSLPSQQSKSALVQSIGSSVHLFPTVISNLRSAGSADVVSKESVEQNANVAEADSTVPISPQTAPPAPRAASVHLHAPEILGVPSGESLLNMSNEIVRDLFDHTLRTAESAIIHKSVSDSKLVTGTSEANLKPSKSDVLTPLFLIPSSDSFQRMGEMLTDGLVHSAEQMLLATPSVSHEFFRPDNGSTTVSHQENEILKAALSTLSTPSSRYVTPASSVEGIISQESSVSLLGIQQVPSVSTGSSFQSATDNPSAISLSPSALNILETPSFLSDLSTVASEKDLLPTDSKELSNPSSTELNAQNNARPASGRLEVDVAHGPATPASSATSLGSLFMSNHPLNRDASIEQLPKNHSNVQLQTQPSALPSKHKSDLSMNADSVVSVYPNSSVNISRLENLGLEMTTTSADLSNRELHLENHPQEPKQTQASALPLENKGDLSRNGDFVVFVYPRNSLNISHLESQAVDTTASHEALSSAELLPDDHSSKRIRAQLSALPSDSKSDLSMNADSVASVYPNSSVNISRIENQALDLMAGSANLSNTELLHDDHLHERSQTDSSALLPENKSHHSMNVASAVSVHPSSSANISRIENLAMDTTENSAYLSHAELLPDDHSNEQIQTQAGAIPSDNKSDLSMNSESAMSVFSNNIINISPIENQALTRSRSKSDLSMNAASTVSMYPNSSVNISRIENHALNMTASSANSSNTDTQRNANGSDTNNDPDTPDETDLGRYLAQHDNKQIRKDSDSFRKAVMSPIIKDGSSTNFSQRPRQVDTHEHVVQPASSTHIHIHGGVSEDDLYSGSELSALDEKYRNAEFGHISSEEAKSVQLRPAPSMDMVSVSSTGRSSASRSASSPSSMDRTQNLSVEVVADSKAGSPNESDETTDGNASSYGASDRSSIKSSNSQKSVAVTATSPSESHQAGGGTPSAATSATSVSSDSSQSSPHPSDLFVKVVPTSLSVDVSHMEAAAAALVSASSMAPHTSQDFAPAASNAAGIIGDPSEFHTQPDQRISSLSVKTAPATPPAVTIEITPAESGSGHPPPSKAMLKDKSLLSASKRGSKHSNYSSRSASSESERSSASGNTGTPSTHGTADSPKAVHGSDSSVSELSDLSSPGSQTSDTSSTSSKADTTTITAGITDSHKEHLKELGEPATGRLTSSKPDLDTKESTGDSVSISIQDMHTSPLSLNVVDNDIQLLTVLSGLPAGASVNIHVLASEHGGSTVSNSDASERSPSDSESGTNLSESHEIPPKTD